MSLIWLIIIVLVVLWLFGFLGRGRWYSTGGTTVSTGTGWAGGSWIHLLIVVAAILLVLRLLNVV